MTEKQSKLALHRELTLALKAALDPPESAVRAWNDLMSDVAFDELSAPVQRVLPAIFSNLQFEDSVIEAARLKGAYRYTWVLNRRLFFAVTPVLQSLVSAGIDFRVTKGLAVLSTLSTIGSRTMSDVDIVIDATSAHAVQAIIAGHGFRSSDVIPCSRHHASPPTGALDFNKGAAKIDVHVVPYRDPELLFRAMLEVQARWVDLGDGAIPVIHPTLLTLHMLNHGEKGFSSTDLAQAVVDVTLLLRTVPGSAVSAEASQLGLGATLVRFLAACASLDRDLRVPPPRSRRVRSRLTVKTSAVGRRWASLRTRLRDLRSRRVDVPFTRVRRHHEIAHPLLYVAWLRAGRTGRLERALIGLTGGLLRRPHEYLPHSSECQPFGGNPPAFVSASALPKDVLDWRLRWNLRARSSAIVLRLDDPVLDEVDVFIFMNGTFVTKVAGGDIDARTVFLRDVPRDCEISIRPMTMVCEECMGDMAQMRIAAEILRTHD